MKIKDLRCNRCNGGMSFENFINTSREGAEWSYTGWHCIFCGEIIDPLILFNRYRSGEEQIIKRREKTARKKGPVLVGQD
jgi:hypothetical protein